MPNHVINIVRVRCEDPEIKRSALMSLVTARGGIDFNKVIKMPTILKNTSSPNRVNPIECIIETGHADWYTWSKENWGTKCSGYSAHFDGLSFPPFKRWHKKWFKRHDRRHRLSVYTCYAARIEKKCFKKWLNDYGLSSLSFSTAWSSPQPVFAALSRKFPDLEFEITFADEDIGSNCGKYVLKDGVMISSRIAPRRLEMSEDELLEWRLFAMRVRNYSSEQIREYLQEVG